MSDSRKGDRITVVSAVVLHIKTTLKENHPIQGYNTLRKDILACNTLKLRWKYKTGKWVKKRKYEKSVHVLNLHVWTYFGVDSCKRKWELECLVPTVCGSCMTFWFVICEHSEGLDKCPHMIRQHKYNKHEKVWDNQIQQKRQWNSVA